MHAVAVIILQYCNWRDTVNCIESMERYNTAPVKYIVVDNGSPDKSVVASLTRYFEQKFAGELLLADDGILPGRILPRMTFLRSMSNDGYAQGNNKGLRLAYGDREIGYTLILNNDTLFVQDIVPKLVNDIESMPDCAFVTPLLYKQNMTGVDRNCARRETSFSYMVLYYFFIMRSYGFMNKNKYYDFNHDGGVKPVQLISGSCMLSKKGLMERIGGFDPNTFLYYEEDILWKKVCKLKLFNYVDTGLKCIHLGGATIGKQVSFNVLKLMFASNRYFVKNYMKYGLIKRIIIGIVQLWAFSVIAVRRMFL